NRSHARLHPLQLLLKRLPVKVHVNMGKFLVIELGFERPTAGNYDDFFGCVGAVIKYEPTRNVDHYIPHADDRDSFSSRKILAGKRGKLIVEIHEILCGIYAPRIFAWQPQFLGCLCSEGKQSSGRLEVSKRFDGN